MRAPPSSSEPAAKDAFPPRQALWVGLSLFSLYVIWGSTYFAIRVAIDAYAPLQMAAVRFAVAGGLLYAVLRLRGQPGPTPRQWGASALVGSLLVVGGNGFVSLAEKDVASSLAAVLVGSMPLWAALFSGLWGQWPTAREWLGLALGAVGVLLLNLESDLRGSPVGATLLLLSPALWALGSVWSRRLPMPEGMMASAAQMLTGSVGLAVLSLALGEPPPDGVHPASLAAVLYLILFGSLVGYSAYGYLLRTVRPALATSYAYVNPLVAVLLGVGLRDEHISWVGYVGTAVILASVAMVALSPRPRR